MDRRAGEAGLGDSRTDYLNANPKLAIRESYNTLQNLGFTFVIQLTGLSRLVYFKVVRKTVKPGNHK